VDSVGVAEGVGVWADAGGPDGGGRPGTRSIKVAGGAAVVGALRHARDLDADKIVVVLIPDTGERYLSKVHSEKWLADNGFKGI